MLKKYAAYLLWMKFRSLQLTDIKIYSHSNLVYHHIIKLAVSTVRLYKTVSEDI